jgi:ribonuclease P protein component
LSDSYFSLSILDNARTQPRLGLAIATRVFGTAVARNTIKRLVRESFRLNQQTLPSIDVVVSARDAARRADARELRASLAKFWKTLAARS